MTTLKSVYMCMYMLSYVCIYPIMHTHILYIYAKFKKCKY